MSRDRIESCLKSGGLLCITAWCMESEGLECRNLFVERRWEGRKGSQKKSGECCDGACHAKAIR